MKEATILLINQACRNISDIQDILNKQPETRVTIADNTTDGLNWLKDAPVDVTLLSTGDIVSAMPLIEDIREIRDSIPVIVVAEKLTTRNVVEAVQQGAFDCLASPEEHELLGSSVAKAINGRSSAVLPKRRSRGQVGNDSCFANIIGKSKKMKEVFTLVKKVCDTDTTVLIQGESGTGKELIAQALHYEGSRRNAPFVPVNCGAIPGELLESELFGHEKGAFTHAVSTRIGRFELANGGTVFLDEISEMSPMLQVKILRVLQERQFERIGGTKTITSDFRIIAATNRDLEAEVEKGTFRQDLYYRLNVIPIKAPPLRDKRQDVALLITHFVDKFNASKRKTIKGITPAAMSHLMDYSWPGNVRELENMIERMVILATGEFIDVGDLPEKILAAEPRAGDEVEEIPAENFFLSETVASFEKKLIIQALNQTNWVKNRAAKLLNLNRTTLIEKMKRYNLAKPQVKL